MASVLLFVRGWKTTHMASNVPKGLGPVAITPEYSVGIKRGYRSLTSIRTASMTIPAPRAKTRSVPVAADTITRNSRLNSQKGSR